MEDVLPALHVDKEWLIKKLHESNIEQLEDVSLLRLTARRIYIFQNSIKTPPYLYHQLNKGGVPSPH